MAAPIPPHPIRTYGRRSRGDATRGIHVAADRNFVTDRHVVSATNRLVESGLHLRGPRMGFTLRFHRLAQRVVIPLTLVLGACQTGTTTVSVKVEPATAEVSPDASQPFTANVGGTFDGRVLWSIVRGPGDIDSETGVYTAPNRIPRDRDNDIVVRATSVVDPERFAEASVRIVNWPFTPRRGPTEGGTVLTMTGSGFSSQTQVLFD